MNPPDTDAAFAELFDSPLDGSATGPLSPSYEWPEPEPFNTVPPSAPFPVSALPPIIKHAVLEAQALTQAPLEMNATSALSAVSVAAQGHADVARDAELVGPISLYLITIGLSGERKTAIDKKLSKGIRQARDVIRERREQEIALVKPLLAAWEARNEALLAALKEVSKGKLLPYWVTKYQAAQQGLPGSPPAGGPTPATLAKFIETELIAHHAAKPAMPEPADLLHEDDTTEALLKSFSRGWPVGAISESEGGVVFGGIAMQKERVMSTFSCWDVLWDAGTYTQKRTSVESRRVHDVRVTINLMCQPVVLSRVLNDHNGYCGTSACRRALCSCGPLA